MDVDDADRRKRQGALSGSLSTPAPAGPTGAAPDDSNATPDADVAGAAGNRSTLEEARRPDPTPRAPLPLPPAAVLPTVAGPQPVSPPAPLRQVVPQPEPMPAPLVPMPPAPQLSVSPQQSPAAGTDYNPRGGIAPPAGQPAIPAPRTPAQGRERLASMLGGRRPAGRAELMTMLSRGGR
jgi:hypothetical protein